MSSDDRSIVLYEGDKLSVVEKPPRDCKAVVDARENMLNAVDLDGFLDGLTTVGKFIRIAYNGVAGHTKLQIAMRELGFEVAELCDDSGLTIGKFRMTADSILTDLTGAYQFFLDDMEDMAITAVESVGTSAKQMAAAAEKLHDRFKEQKEKVLKVCKDTASEKGTRETEVKRLEEEQKKKEAEREKIEEEKALAAKEQERLQTDIDKAMVEEEKISENLAPNAADAILGVVTLGIFPLCRMAKASKAMDNIQSKINRLHDNKKDQAERQRKALKDMEVCVKAIAEISNKDIPVQEQAINALHGAVGALANLATIMQDAAVFWRSMQNTCEEQASGKLESLLGKAQKIEDPEKRLNAYRSVAVKKRAIQKYVTWVAMEVVCDEYVRKIKASRQELYGYLRENPTIEESKSRIELLCREFSEKIDAENKKIDDNLKQIEADKKKIATEAAEGQK